MFVMPRCCTGSSPESPISTACASTGRRPCARHIWRFRALLTAPNKRKSSAIAPPPPGRYRPPPSLRRERALTEDCMNKVKWFAFYQWTAGLLEEGLGRVNRRGFLRGPFKEEMEAAAGRKIRILLAPLGTNVSSRLLTFR